MTASQPRWELLTPEEAAVILRVSRATMYRRLAGKRPWPHHLIQGRKLISAGDMDAILAKRARGVR